MANARKPDNLHLLQGTLQPCRHGDPDKKPKPKGKIGDPPEWMSDIAKTEWHRKKKILADAGLLFLADDMIFAQYCLLVEDLQKEQLNFTAAKHTQLRLVQMEMGMTPASRSKITIDTDDDEDDF